MDLTLLRDYAFRFVGTPYLYGGKTPMSGEDCSGFVSELLKFSGVLSYDAKMNAQMIHDFLLPTSASLLSPTLGAIVFYGSGTDRISHVAFCIDYMRAIGADGGHDDTLSLDKAISENAYVKGLPVKYRSDVVKLLMPRYP